MRLSKTELRILAQLAEGNNKTKEIASALNKSLPQIYRSGQKLIKKGWITSSRREYEPIKNTPSSLLLQSLREFPSLIEPFSDSGLLLLSYLTEPKSLQELKNVSKMSRTQILKKIRQAKKISLLRKEQKRYVLQDKLWVVVANFIRELKEYEKNIDPRVPANSTIYFKTEKEIVFSNPKDLDAAPTAFSAYEKYGIKILSPVGYYVLPKKKLSKKEVFVHSLYIAEKEKEIRDLIYLVLFYLKHKKALQKVKHPVLKEIKMVLTGKRIPGYPLLTEIKEKAEIYDIKL
ncbi:MAG TPA: helix-turn-helix domain-containing protein [Candidatus Nanoarchaeia archaeon]|nr:helix-turn-helix domain-containing protein [Candidatus Nanoarchaeia archaeon]